MKHTGRDYQVVVGISSMRKWYRSLDTKLAMSFAEIKYVTIIMFEWRIYIAHIKAIGDSIRGLYV